MNERWLPTLPEVSREAIAVLAGVVIAALIVQMTPPLRKWLDERLPWR